MTLEAHLEFLIECANTPEEIKIRREFVETLQHAGMIVKSSEDRQPLRRGFMCKVDFDHELGEAVGGNTIYGDEEDCRKNRRCIDTCGMVEVEVRLKRVVQEEDFMSDAGQEQTGD